MGTVQVISAITALISVLVSATVSLVTIRMNSKQAEQKSVAELTAGVMPRRLNALEEIWSGLFALESGAQINSKELDGIIRSSMWLPPALREKVLAPFIDFTQTHDIPALRTELYVESGAKLLDRTKARFGEIAK